MGEVRGHGRRTLAYAAVLSMAGCGLPSGVCAGEDPTTVEYRRSLFGRFEAVAFVCAGAVADTFGNLFSRTLLRAGGGGLRYLAVPAGGVNISIDYVWGKSGSGGLYGYIGDVLRHPEPMGPKSNTAVPSRALAWRATGAMGPVRMFLAGRGRMLRRELRF